MNNTDSILDSQFTTGFIVSGKVDDLSLVGSVEILSP